MTTSINCPHCNISLKLPESVAGKAVKCPKCSERFQTPAPQAATLSMADVPASPLVPPVAQAQPGAQPQMASPAQPQMPPVTGPLMQRGLGPFLSRLRVFDLFFAGGILLLLLAGPTPWASLGPFSASGFAGDGTFVFLAGLGCVGLMIHQLVTGKMPKWSVIVLLILGAVGALIGLIGLGNTAETEGLVTPGFGMFSSLLGGAAVMFASIIALVSSPAGWVQRLKKPLQPGAVV